MIRIVHHLQQEVARCDVPVPYHTSFHMVDLAFKAALTCEHAFLDPVADTLRFAVSFCNNSPFRLKSLHAVVQAVDSACPKLAIVHTRRWCAFAVDAFRRTKGSYVIVGIGLREVVVSRAAARKLRYALLLAITNEVFLCALFFMLGVKNAWALMSQVFQIMKRCAHCKITAWEPCIAKLDRLVKWEGEEWRQFNDALVLREGSNTQF